MFPASVPRQVRCPALTTENIESKSLDNLEKIEIFRLMHNLDDVTREVMYLRLAGELQFSEIAAILGKTENWARVTYYRGKQKIMKGMREISIAIKLRQPKPYNRYIFFVLFKNLFTSEISVDGVSISK